LLRLSLVAPGACEARCGAHCPRILPAASAPILARSHSSFATADVALSESIQPLFGVMLPNGARISKP
jgi:hypothetical protein